MNKKKISITTPVFQDRSAEAAYWEKNFDHAWKSGKPVSVTVAKNLSETINIRLDPDILDEVRQKARKKGLGPTQLARMWIMEKIR